MIRRPIAWILILAMAVLTVWRFVSSGLWRRSVFGDPGLGPYALEAGVIAAAIFLAMLLRPRFAVLAAAAAAAVAILLAAGPKALFAVLLLLVSSYSAGRIMLRRIEKHARPMTQTSILLGLAAWILLIELTARWPLHHAAVYWPLLFVPIFYALRQGLIPPLRRPSLPESRSALLPWAIAAVPLFLLLLAALKPEAGPEALSSYMVLPARFAAAHRWSFAVGEFAWAVEPAASGFAFSLAWLLGGEPAARLLNFAVFFLICWTLYERLHARVPGWIAGALTAAFASTPLALRAAGSLSPMNFAAAFLLASALLLRRYRRERRNEFFLASAFLAGSAAACSLSAAAFAIPILLASTVMVKFHALARGWLLAIIAGGVPYAEAWLRTGNPVFPWWNDLFRSPLLPPSTQLPAAPPRPPSWSLPDQLTFSPESLFQSPAGSFGFLVYLFLPLAVLSVRRRWPRTAILISWILLTGMAIAFRGILSLDGLYPLLPLFTLLAGIAAATYRAGDPRLGAACGALAALCILLHLSILPVAAPEHRRLLPDPLFRRASLERYLAETAPERLLAERLRTLAPASSAAWFDSAGTAPFTGRALTATWRHEAFARRIREATSPEALNFIAQDERLEYFIAPAPDSPRRVSSVYTREFLDRFTRPISSAGGFELRRLMPPDPELLSRPPLFAPPGTHDELNSYVHYEGRWTRRLDEPFAFNRTLTLANDLRSRVAIRFRGSAVTLIQSRGLNRCPSLLVSLDGAEPLPLSQYAPRASWQDRSPVYRAAAPGEHTLTLSLVPDRMRRSPILACWFGLDGFTVE
jgi:hypothetical protein